MSDTNAMESAEIGAVGRFTTPMSAQIKPGGEAMARRANARDDRLAQVSLEGGRGTSSGGQQPRAPLFRQR